MRKLASVALILAANTYAYADKYGIDESIAEGSTDLRSMILGGVIFALIYWLWKKFF